VPHAGKDNCDMNANSTEKDFSGKGFENHHEVKCDGPSLGDNPHSSPEVGEGEDSCTATASSLGR